jgi:predicted nucleotidyltransferase
MVDEATVAKAVELLRQAAPGAKIILFGSHARGDAGEDSDLDFLVVEPEVKNRWDEMVRLRDALRPLRVRADVLVISQDRFEYWADTPGTVYCEAAKEGRVFDATARAG